MANIPTTVEETTGRRIDRNLRSLFTEVKNLPSVGERWSEYSEAERVSFSLGWDHLVTDYLAELRDLAGEMNRDQQGRYMELLSKLAESKPITANLNLYPPPLSESAHQDGERLVGAQDHQSDYTAHTQQDETLGGVVGKAQLIQKIAEVTHHSKSEAQRFFEAFQNVVADALRDDEQVQITGFGKFYVQKRDARQGINPQTNQKIDIPASKVPKFTAGNALKDSIK